MSYKTTNAQGYNINFQFCPASDAQIFFLQANTKIKCKLNKNLHVLQKNLKWFFPFRVKYFVYAHLNNKCCLKVPRCENSVKIGAVEMEDWIEPQYSLEPDHLSFTIPKQACLEEWLEALFWPRKKTEKETMEAVWLVVILLI